MSKKYKFEFDSEKLVLFKYHYGNITIQDIIYSWEHAFEHDLIPDNVKGFILDYRAANLDIYIEDYKKIVEFYRNNLEIFGNHKFAIITENPEDIVIPTLVSTEDRGYYSSKPFSTVKGALKWILG